MSQQVINDHAAFIWSVADLLRGDYKQSEYGKVILPLTGMRSSMPSVRPATSPNTDLDSSRRSTGPECGGDRGLDRGRLW